MMMMMERAIGRLAACGESRISIAWSPNGRRRLFWRRAQQLRGFEVPKPVAGTLVSVSKSPKAVNMSRGKLQRRRILMETVDYHRCTVDVVGFISHKR